MRSALLLSLLVAVSAAGQSAHPEARNVGDLKLMSFPGLPTCSPGAVQSGDPRSGPSIIYAKVAAGCTIPWHWHTPTETLMIVSGSAVLQPKDGKASTLRAGGFAVMPSHHVHKFSCPNGCTMFVSSDAAFDIHYVDKDEKEISPDDAMKPLKQTAAKPPAQ